MQSQRNVLFGILVSGIGTAIVSPTFAAHPAVLWEDLPLIRTGVKIRSYSSYNPTGRTYRDFMNYTTREGRDYEMAHHQGSPGMLVGLWFTDISWHEDAAKFFSAASFGKVKLFLSGKERPDFAKQRDDYFTESTWPHLQPSWGMHALARWGFPLLGFDSAFRATCTEPPHWYQFTCHLYRDARFDETVSRQQLEAWNRKIARPVGSFPGKEPGNQTRTGRVTLEPTGSQVLLDLGAGGVIRRVRLKPGQLSSEMLDAIWIKLLVDDEVNVAAHVPLSVFFGGYEQAPMTKARGLPCGYDGSRLYFCLPMPFWKTMRIELENRGSEEVAMDYEIGYCDDNPYSPEHTGTLRIQYNPSTEVRQGAPDFAHLQVQGSGHIVGTTANLAGSIEGNFRTYIDGMKTPSTETTGGEDYFCHAFGIREDLQTPFHGGIVKTIVGYRFHIADYIPFQNSILFCQDHGHDFTHDKDGTFRSAVFYYWHPEPCLTLTDSLDVGDPRSEQTHQYRISATKRRLQTDEAAYEGNFTELFEDAGYWSNGESSFKVDVDPDNDGVRLRKRINQLLYHQALDVFVDDQPAGRWFEQGSQYQILQEKQMKVEGYSSDWKDINKRFRDTEFEISAALTQGKSSLNIRLKTIGSKAAIHPEDEGMTNAYYYWVYCYTKQ